MQIEKIISEPAMRLLEKKGEAKIIKIPLQICDYTVIIAKYKGLYYKFKTKDNIFLYEHNHQGLFNEFYTKSKRKYEVD